MINEIANTAKIATVETRLTRGLIAPRSRQSRMAGPKRGWVISQLCRRSDEREKQYAASNMKGTVGKSGSTAPNKPNATLIKPKVAQSARTP